MAEVNYTRRTMFFGQYVWPRHADADVRIRTVCRPGVPGMTGAGTCGEFHGIPLNSFIEFGLFGHYWPWLCIFPDRSTEISGRNL